MSCSCHETFIQRCAHSEHYGIVKLNIWEEYMSHSTCSNPQTSNKQTDKKPTKEHKEILGGDGYVSYLGGGDGIMGTCKCPNSSRYMQ